MNVKIVHSPSEVFDFLKSKPRYDYIYQFNNLAEEEWSNVICYGLYDQSKLLTIAMLHIHYPALLAASFDNQSHTTELIRCIRPLLPPKFYTHIDRATLESVFSPAEITNLEEYMNMGLADDSVLAQPPAPEVVQLTSHNVQQIRDLLAVSYPEAWLDEDLVKLGKNYGLAINDQLVSFAGIHAYSEAYQVAAVAHVTTRPNHRQRGYSEQVLTALIKDLRQTIPYIGLNVKVDNLPAIKCYTKLGFTKFGCFVACDVTNSL